LLSVLAALGATILQAFLLMTGHISGSNTFPQPLSEADEAKYLKRLAGGDQTARDVLVERNLRLVAHVVKKFDNTGEDIDDLISIGTIGLIKGIKTFNPEKGTRLATYAARCIENEILMYLRSAKRVRAEVSLYDPIGVDREGNEITLLDVLGADNPDVVPDQVEGKFEEARLREKLGSLEGKEREVLQLRYGLGSTRERKTQREIAWLLGISRSYVSRIEKRALERILGLLTQ
jgi:RNA polymerase sporulation-specific sigma factor